MTNRPRPTGNNRPTNNNICRKSYLPLKLTFDLGFYPPPPSANCSRITSYRSNDLGYFFVGHQLCFGLNNAGIGHTRRHRPITHGSILGGCKDDMQTEFI